ncbi:MAG TPA: ExeM/NucH family extracellular endonuclease, partial [Humibacillus xanthopallidus]|nr:ExeM/NucH family extracellular endonuclease [Humibacillus xanthopallidus]
DVGGTTRVAGMNLLNFFNTFSGCRSGVEGGAIDCRGAENATEFDRQWRKTVAAVSGTQADVVAFMEMENDGYGPDSAESFLVDKLNEKDGAGTWAFIDADKATGQTDALGDDAIKVGMLYKPGKVTPVGRTAVLNSVAFVNGGDAAPRNRPALAQAFRDNVTGGVFVGVANHLKSKGSACDQPDQNDGQANCSAVRTRSAALLADWLAGDPTGTGDPDVLILGDLNSYAKENPITTLEKAGFTNLIEKSGGSEAYSYAFDGQWGYLDHALGTASITAQTTAVRDWHINADEPNVLDYNTNFKSQGQISSLYAPDEFRISDHDPVIVGLDLTDDAAGFVTGGGFIQSPAGALVADPTRAGKGAFQIDLDYAAGATHPTGSFVYSLGGAGTPFSLTGTSFDFLVIRAEAARFSGAATVNGSAGFTYTVDVLDAGKSDTFRLRVTAADGSLVYDSGVKSVQGQIKIHP